MLIESTFKLDIVNRTRRGSRSREQKITPEFVTIYRACQDKCNMQHLRLVLGVCFSGKLRFLS